MNLNEIRALLTEVMKCPIKESTTIEDIFISLSKPYDPEGWKLCIKKSLVDYEALSCLKVIAEECKLKIDSKLKEGYFVISSK